MADEPDAPSAVLAQPIDPSDAFGGGPHDRPRPVVVRCAVQESRQIEDRRTGTHLLVRVAICDRLREITAQGICEARAAIGIQLSTFGGTQSRYSMGLRFAQERRSGFDVQALPVILVGHGFLRAPVAIVTRQRSRDAVVAQLQDHGCRDDRSPPCADPTGLVLDLAVRTASEVLR